MLTKKEQEFLAEIEKMGVADANKLAEVLGIVPSYAAHRIKIMKLKGHITQDGRVTKPTHTVAEVAVRAINKEEKVKSGEKPILDVIECDIDVKTLIPENDPKYKYRKGVDDVVKRFAERNQPLFLIGEAGSGKTWSVRQYAADKKLPFLRVACDDSAVLKEFIGKREIINGTTVFRMGLLIELVQQPSVILFDEFNALPASKLFFLHELLDTRKLFIKDAGSGLVVDVHPQCVICLACNPNNAKYAGTNKVNVALADRGGYLLVPNFMPDEVAPMFDCGKGSLTDALKRFYLETHRVIREQNLRIAFSLRAVQRISSFLREGDAVGDALQYGFYNCALLTATEKEREALKQIARVCFGPDAVR